MDNKALIEKFYQGFSNKNAEQMTACYHDDIVFEDPAFGVLKGEEAKSMWKMLLSRNGKIKIEFHNIQADGNTGSANWVATYNYGPAQRKVINKVSAQFEFKDGKISKHTDYFNLWNWSKQALGISGLLLGWTGFMRKQIQKKTNALLKTFMAK